MMTVKQRYCAGRKKTHRKRMTRKTMRGKKLNMNGIAKMI